MEQTGEKLYISKIIFTNKKLAPYISKRSKKNTNLWDQMRTHVIGMLSDWYHHIQKENTHKKIFIRIESIVYKRSQNGVVFSFDNKVDPDKRTVILWLEDDWESLSLKKKVLIDIKAENCLVRRTLKVEFNFFFQRVEFVLNFSIIFEFSFTKCPYFVSSLIDYQFFHVIASSFIIFQLVC